MGINDGKKCYANSIEMHQDQTFTSKNILYFILEIGAGEGGGEVAEKSEPSTSRTLNFWLRPFFFEFAP